jgi:hypothetical protein
MDSSEKYSYLTKIITKLKKFKSQLRKKSNYAKSFTLCIAFMSWLNLTRKDTFCIDLLSLLSIDLKE